MNDQQNFNNAVVKFKYFTDQLNNYNEIFNLNVYLKNSNTLHKDKLNKNNETLKSQNLKLKQEYILQDREKAFLGFKNNILHFTIMVVAALLIVVGMHMNQKIGMTMFIVIVSVVTLFFILCILFVVKVNSDRRNLSWNQYYWDPMVPKT